MKKSLFLLTLISLLATSCNVVQMLTQAKTDVPDNFFDRHGSGPDDHYIFMSCSGSPCYFDTKTETATNMDPGSTISSPEEFYPYKGSIFFKGYDGASQAYQTYRYDLANNNLNLFETNAGKSFKEYDGDLFYISDAGQLRAITSPTGTSTNLLTLTAIYASTYWLHADNGDSGSGNFYLCRDDSGAQLYRLNISYSGGPVTATEILVQDSGGNNVPCSFSHPYGDNGHIVYADGGALIYDYKIQSNILYSISGGSDLASIWYDYDGTFFFQDYSNQELLSYNINNDTVVNTLLGSGQFTPANFLKIINSPDGKTFYINKDTNNDDQLFEMTYVNNIPQHNQLSNLNNTGGNILFFEIGSKGFYFVRADGVWTMDFDGAISQVYTGPISNNDFRSYSYREVHKNY